MTHPFLQNALSRHAFVPLTTQRLQNVIDDTAVELAEVDVSIRQCHRPCPSTHQQQVVYLSWSPQYGELLVESGLAPIVEAMDTKNEAVSADQWSSAVFDTQC